MFNTDTLSIVNRYWAGHLGCPVDDLFTEPLRLLTHGGELTGYWGAFALFRGDSAMVSFPPEGANGLRESLSDHLTSHGFGVALAPVAERVIGPAYIGYTSLVPPIPQSARALQPGDLAAVDDLQGSCDPVEWEHGGSSPEDAASGVFVGGKLVALAGYEIWGGTIAHISIVTHPEYRGRGFGRSAVAHVAARAIAAGLLPQYRTLESNHASICIAGSLGFQPYATSMAVRLKAKL